MGAGGVGGYRAGKGEGRCGVKCASRDRRRRSGSGPAGIIEERIGKSGEGGVMVGVDLDVWDVNPEVGLHPPVKPPSLL